jgi:hypothetical protein
MKIRIMRKNMNRKEREMPAKTALDRRVKLEMLIWHEQIREKFKELRK